MLGAGNRSRACEKNKGRLMNRLFVIGDLHFSQAVNKPMDIFGKQWENHQERICQSWRETVDDGDVVVVNGDISWGLKLSEALPDLALIDSLPGKKIIMKGNHELWWSTLTKVRQLFKDNNLNTLFPLYNNAYFWPERGLLLCGTRGWKTRDDPAFCEEDEKIYNRELQRARVSVNYGLRLAEGYYKGGQFAPAEIIGGAAGTGEITGGEAGIGKITAGEAGAGKITDGEAGIGKITGGETGTAEIIGGETGKKIGNAEVPEIIMFFHYPPFDFAKRNPTDFTQILQENNIKKCFFGHIHGAGKTKYNENGAVMPVFRDGSAAYYLTAADYLGLCPAEIL